MDTNAVIRLFHRIVPAVLLALHGGVWAQNEGAGSNAASTGANTPSAGAYSPDRVAPRFGTEFNPDGSPRSAGISDKPYDSWEDPNHPLKSPKPPPKKWVERDVPVDRDGDGQPDVDENGNPITKPGTVFPQDGSPPVQRAKGDIDWGERYYDSHFDQLLSATNKCNEERPITITVNGLPYLTLPDNVAVGAGETKVIRGAVKLPPEPPPPPRLGLPGEPGWGWVDFPPIPAGQPFPPPKLHQPNFVQIDGTVELWHPWAPASAGDEGDCLPRLVTYTVTGHIHFRPPPPADAGPSRLATPDVCEVYWNTGVAPKQLGTRDCTPEMRTLAHAFVDRQLAPYIENAPEEWLWLASMDIDRMSIGHLLDMKRRAEGILAW
ncbi:MAG: hypothetical protein H2060_11490 [Azoarcus sp.]|nr:hypothetical protein [Azoarcus sp.]